MEDTSTLLETSTTLPIETTASPAVPAAEEDLVEPKVDEGGAADEVDKLAGQAGGEVETSKPTLPNELVNHVLSYLEERDKRTLAACCRVSRTFLAVARPRLYRTIWFNLDIWLSGMGDTMTINTRPSQWALYHALLHHRHLARLVKVLRLAPHPTKCEYIYDEWERYLGPVLPDNYSFADMDRWAELHSVDINFLLGCTTGVEQLHVADMDDSRVRWYTYDVLARILHSTTLPTLRTVTLPTFYPEITASAPNLSSLTVTADFTDGLRMSEIKRCKPPILESLVCRIPSDPLEVQPHPLVPHAFTWLTTHSLDSLRTLSAFYDDFFHPSLSFFRSLRTLSLTVDSDYQNVWQLMSFRLTMGTLPVSLRRLKVRNRAGSRGMGNLNFEVTFLAALPPHLQFLTVVSGPFSAPVWRAFVDEKEEVVPDLKELRLSRRESAYKTEEEQAEFQKAATEKGFNVRFDA